ncbi:MAG: stage III sporulation protein AA [Lachnospiraceae bacterium]|nr:stage III sporulation protein AA [Lachnospiraceae bacterium]
MGRLSIDWERLQEIRLRISEPVILRYGGKEYFLAQEGFLSREPDVAVHIHREELKEAMEYISNYSRYAYEEEMRQGFLTIQGGHRIGLAGRVIREDNHIKGMQHISCMNVRLAHEVIGCGKKVLPYLLDGKSIHNTLIISPPCGGKTTLLRDIIRLLSEGVVQYKESSVSGFTVGVVDERSEIGSCYQGIPQNDLGRRTDILDACPKVEGIFLLVRSMSPQVIAVDEIGSVADVEAMEYAMNSGVKLLATVHGATMEEIRKKPGLARLVKEKVFERYILLGGKVGQVRAVFDGRGTVVTALREREGAREVC